MLTEVAVSSHGLDLKAFKTAVQASLFEGTVRYSLYGTAANTKATA